MYPKTLQNIIDFYRKHPGVGEKSAERMALATISLDEEDLSLISDCLKNVKTKIKKCKICGNLTENEICTICSDDLRDEKLICVVEDYKNVFAFEKIGSFKGKYHVLDGLISPMENINPDDINLHSLIKRCRNIENCELILALKSSIEGEATTLYIKKILENDKVNISRLSYGIPIGADLDYLDALTLDKALEDRKKIKSE